MPPAFEQLSNVWPNRRLHTALLPPNSLLISHDNLQEAGNRLPERRYFMALAKGHESAQLSTLNRQQKQKAQVERAAVGRECFSGWNRRRRSLQLQTFELEGGNLDSALDLDFNDRRWPYIRASPPRLFEPLCECNWSVKPFTICRGPQNRSRRTAVQWISYFGFWLYCAIDNDSSRDVPCPLVVFSAEGNSNFNHQLNFRRKCRNRTSN